MPVILVAKYRYFLSVGVLVSLISVFSLLSG